MSFNWDEILISFFFFSGDSFAKIDIHLQMVTVDLNVSLDIYPKASEISSEIQRFEYQALASLPNFSPSSNFTFSSSFININLAERLSRFIK